MLPFSTVQIQPSQLDFPKLMYLSTYRAQGLAIALGQAVIPFRLQTGTFPSPAIFTEELHDIGQK